MLLSSLLFISSCKKGGRSKVKNVDREPNDNIKKAVLLKSDTGTFVTKLESGSDVDWFKFNIPAPGYYIVITENTDIPKEIYLAVQFYYYDDTKPYKTVSISGDMAFPAILHVDQPGTYYFTIREYWEQSYEEPIVFKTRFIKEFDKYEINDWYDMARDLDINSQITFYIYPYYDHDWFKIKLNGQKGYLKAMVKETHDEVTPELRYYTYDEWSKEKVKVYLDWNKLPVSIPLPNEKFIYLELHDDWDDKQTLEPYTLKLQYLPEMDSLEPNDDYQHATVAHIGDTLNVAIFPRYDKDYFKLTIPDTDSVTLLALNYEGDIKPEVKFFTLDNYEKLKDYSDWHLLPFTFAVEPGKTYYFCLHDDWEDAESEKPFQLIIK